jgi:pyruvate formate lyase activating enzyme
MEAVTKFQELERESGYSDELQRGLRANTILPTLTAGSGCIRWCIDCGLCAEKYPNKAIELQRDSKSQKSKLRVDRIECNLCGECISVCSSKALEILGTYYLIPELLRIVEKNRPLYRKSVGGITLTGGEPLYQWESTLELLEQCRKRGIHTVVETSTYGGEEAFERILVHQM